jgi:hypothetical protein
MEKLQKVDLINDLIFYNRELEGLWDFHPDNPESKSIRLEYNKLKLKISAIQTQLDTVEDEIGEMEEWDNWDGDFDDEL